jgi:formate dehydrogenase major subunit
MIAIWARPRKRRRACFADIDGIDVTVPEGTSVMRAAAEAGHSGAQAVCDRQRRGLRVLPPLRGGDRGRRGTPASCTTPVAEGMVVHTQAEKVKKIRKGVMELYISDHPLDCLTCAANGDCELQDMAGAVGLRDVRYEAPPEAPLANHFEARNTSGEANPEWIAKDDVEPVFHL